MNKVQMMPNMPELQVNYSDDENEDVEEEKNLMLILQKLKNAKCSIDESRKRFLKNKIHCARS
jgi:hypothetical protein